MGFFTILELSRNLSSMLVMDGFSFMPFPDSDMPGSLMTIFYFLMLRVSFRWPCQPAHCIVLKTGHIFVTFLTRYWTVLNGGWPITLFRVLALNFMLTVSLIATISTLIGILLASLVVRRQCQAS